MKTDIHPKYFECQVTCGCGETFTTRSTKKEIKVEICSACHPFYTGRQKFVDTAGRVEKFLRRYGMKNPQAEEGAEEGAEEQEQDAPENAEA